MNTAIEYFDIGCRFEPSDEVLINCYLLPKIRGRPLPPNLILERDVYAAAPWDVFGDVDDSSPFWHRDRHSNGAKKSIYVFTKVAKKTPNSTRNSRKAGCGTWSGSTGPNMIRQSSGHVVGHSKMLTFESSEKVDARLGHWIMHEYCLNGLSLRTIGRGTTTDDVVLCKITKGVKKPHRRRVPRPIVESTKKRPRPADQQGSVNTAAGVDCGTTTTVGSLEMQHQENGLDYFGSISNNGMLDDMFLIDDSYSHFDYNL